MLKAVDKNILLHYIRFLWNNKRLYSVKTFQDLPTLRQIPLAGHSYLFLPGGKYKAERLTEAVIDISRRLGPIFKLNLGGTNIVITTYADNTEILCRNEGKYPIRPPFPALLHYRRETYDSVGVVPGNGEEWYKYRQGVKPLLRANIVQGYKNRHEEIASDFIGYVERNRSEIFVLEDVFQHALRYAIEAISVISPGYRFKCLSVNANEADEIINASTNFMDGLYATLIGPPIWKYYKNSGYRKLESSHSTIHRILEHHLRDVNVSNRDKSETVRNIHPYLYALLNNDSFTWNDKLMLAMEVFLGGIDATATTIAVTLQQLACNSKVQGLAREESLRECTNMSYLRACVKETLRMFPTAGAHSRVTIGDINIGGYLIPKNTLVSAFTSITSNKEEYFKEPHVYKPERWLRSANSVVHHHFASLPFGFGARMCPGRRIAEQEIVILLKEILKTYQLELQDNGDRELGMIYRMNRIPDRKINLKFINTNC